MTEETAKELAAAMRQLADAIKGLGSNGLMPGIHVHHHGPNPISQINPFQPYHPGAAGAGNDPNAWRTS